MFLEKILKKPFITTLSLGLLSWGTISCNSEKPQATNASGIVRPLADDTVIIEYAGGKITAKELNEFLKKDLERMKEEAVESYQQGARQVLLQKLIEAKAKEKSLTPGEMMEMLPGMQTVSDADIDAFFKSQPELKKGVRNPQTGQMQKVSREDVGKYLNSQNRRSAQQAFAEELMRDSKVVMKLELPPPPALQVKSSRKAASFGPANAKVVIHEFSDFQCPFCSRAKNTVTQIKEAYGDKVRIEFRHFPLDNHPEARPASVATVCANEQGKFWELHDKIFDNFQSINAANLDKWAQELGLDMAKFKACTQNKDSDAIVSEDMEEGRRLGVDSTPAFIVNGQLVKGAQPFDRFKQLIDAALAK